MKLSTHSSSGNSFGRLHSWGEALAAAGRQLLSLLTPPLLQLLAVAAAALLLLYMALCYQGFHFRVAQAYARLGYPHAQHIVGQRYLQGAGVEKSEDLAMHWFRQAAGQGHPHSSFNLALGALRNMTAALEEGEVEKLLSVAAAHGLQEAQELLENILKSRNLP
ncbi:Secretory immunoglobulin A-binding protein EsiB-like protein [Aix galericulata]|nr:Secretory immunoglobulin A-binding protein EsiB-like protein [Aix galericulata]